MINEKPTKIMLFGTFDGIHKGHLNLFRQARGLSKNPFLIVSVARDKNVKRIKGKFPIQNEKKRVIALKMLHIFQKVILGSMKNYFLHIQKEKPDIIALGYDQIEYVKELRKDLKEKKLKTKIVRLKPYKEKTYKSHLINKVK